MRDRGGRNSVLNAFCVLGTLHEFFHLTLVTITLGFPGDSVVKNLPANAGDAGSIPRSGRSLGAGNDNPLQYSCLGSPMNRGAWWATVREVPKQSHMT